MEYGYLGKIDNKDYHYRKVSDNVWDLLDMYGRVVSVYKSKKSLLAAFRKRQKVR